MSTTKTAAPMRAWDIYRLAVGTADARFLLRLLGGPDRVPARRILAAVCARLREDGHVAKAGALAALAAEWHGEVRENGTPRHKLVAVQERRGAAFSYLYVEVALEGFAGVMPGDLLQLRSTAFVAVVKAKRAHRHRSAGKPLAAWDVLRIAEGADPANVEAALADGPRPARRILDTVAERLRERGARAQADALRELRETWYGVTVRERRGTGASHLFVEVPLDAFAGVMPGDLLQLRCTDGCAVLSLQDGSSATRRVRGAAVVRETDGTLRVGGRT